MLGAKFVTQIRTAQTAVRKQTVRTGTVKVTTPSGQQREPHSSTGTVGPEAGRKNCHANKQTVRTGTVGPEVTGRNVATPCQTQIRKQMRTHGRTGRSVAVCTARTVGGMQLAIYNTL